MQIESKVAVPIQLSEGLDLESIIDSGRLSTFQVAIMVCCALIAMMDGFDTQAIAFVAPEIATAWHIEPARFGPVFGAGLLGGLVGAMILGMASDRFGRKPILLSAVALFAAGSLLAPFAATVIQLSAVRFVTGIGLGGALPSFIALTSEYAPRRLRATLVSLMFCGFPLGAVIGGFASAKLVPLFGWTSVFIAGGILPLLVLPVFIVFIPESVRFLVLKKDHASITRVLRHMKSTLTWSGKATTASPAPRVPLASLFTHGRAAGTFLLWITLFLSLLMTYFLINWIPIIARRGGLGIESAIIAVSMLNLGSIVGCVVIGWLADRFGPAVVIGPAFTLGAVAIALIGYAGESGALLCAIAFAAGALSIGAQMCTIALCASFYETVLRATGVGWSIGVSRVGAIVGPVVGGILLGAGVGSSSLFVIAGLISFGAAMAMFAMGWFVLRVRAPAMDEPFKPNMQGVT
jgi:AAHS family 4-hydroxybenzoate transporter-like MFS transporter